MLKFEITNKQKKFIEFFYGGIVCSVTPIPDSVFSGKEVKWKLKISEYEAKRLFRRLPKEDTVLKPHLEENLDGSG